MGIGFQSFGGMLTGGGDEAPVEVENTTVQQLEQKEVLSDEDADEVKKEIEENEISYNDVNK
jgi:Na+-transporting NADH:ubiquinone oxidoreductase subunit E